MDLLSLGCLQWKKQKNKNITKWGLKENVTSVGEKTGGV